MARYVFEIESDNKQKGEIAREIVDKLHVKINGSWRVMNEADYDDGTDGETIWYEVI